MCACQPTIPEHRIAVDAWQATGLAHATALRDVVQHREQLGRLQLRAKQRRPLPLCEACLTARAGEQAQMLLLPVAHTDGQVASSALAMVSAVSIVTAKLCEIVHLFPSPFSAM